MNLRNSASKTASIVLASVAAFLVVTYGEEFLSEQQVIAQMDEQREKFREEGAKKYPELTASEALGIVATESITKTLDSETDSHKKMQTAAYSFLGFYFFNMNERSVYCSELDVSISPFTVAFERLHVAELTKARELTSEGSVQEQKLLTLLKPQFRPAVIRDMTDISSLLDVPVKDVCHIYSQNGETIAEEMHISKRIPSVYTALMSGER